MKTNPIRVAVSQNKVQVGTWLNMIRNPAILKLLQASGLDFARVDMEHSSPSIETIADMALFARALDFPIIVRPPDANREWITRLLDAGVWNLHCPQVDTPDHAREIVEASRYAPIGSRGMIGIGPGTDFDSTNDVKDRLDFANKQVFITVMFESAESFDHIDEIASMNGIDALTLGPTDLAQNLGVFGAPDEEKVIDEYRHLIVSAANKYGKTTAMRVLSSFQARQWKAAGALLLAYSSEVSVLMNGYQQAIGEIKA